MYTSRTHAVDPAVPGTGLSACQSSLYKQLDPSVSIGSVLLSAWTESDCVHVQVYFFFSWRNVVKQEPECTKGWRCVFYYETRLHSNNIGLDP